MTHALLKKNINIQDTIRGSLNNIYSAVAELDNSEDNSEEALLEAYLETCNAEATNLNSLNNEIIKLIDQAEQQDILQEQVSEHFSFNIKLRTAISKLRSILSKPKDSDSISVANSQTGSNSGRNNAKLPKLCIKHFDGNPLFWKSFIDTFTQSK